MDEGAKTNRRVPAEFSVWAALIASLVLFGIVALATYRSTSELTPVLEELDRTRRISGQTARFLTDFGESQSARRAYLLSGDEYFLSQYRATMQSARLQLQRLEPLATADSTQRARLRRLGALVANADSLGEVTIQARQRRGVEAAAALVRSRVGHEAAQEVERVARDIDMTERQRVAEALDVARGRAVTAQQIAIGSAALALLLLPGAAYTIWRDLQARRKTARQLHDASREAEAATRAKSEFLASMSHEIRTPLNGVIGMTELTLETKLTSTQRDYLLTARSSAESLLRLLNDILDFSKIEAGRLDLESTTFGLRDLIGETLRAMTIRAEQKKLELAYRVLPDVPDCLIGDPGRFQQIVVNLVGNAIKFTEQGEIVVLVESEPVDESSVTLRVSVKDTGIGIPKERTRAIFELFSQADSSTTRRFGGTGLGLSISEQLVKLMGGTIWVESEVGKGSTFHFTVTLQVGEQRPLPRATLAQLEGLRVLVLDDHPTNRLILEEMLTAWHMRPASASTGAQAISLASDAKRAGAAFQVGVFDNLLPDLDGYTVAERLSSGGLLAGPQIIILSSDNQPGNAERRAALGISRVLMKPAKQSELLDSILTAAAGAAPEAPRPDSEAAERWKGARMLVVEDNVVNQRVAQGLLERRGVDVTIAQNGAEAVELLSREAPAFDLVFMDVEMPVMDGLDATRRIRALEVERGMPRIPIVAVTAHALAEEKRRCEEAGMDDCLTKPLRARELDTTLDRFLGRAALSPNPAGTASSESAVLELVDGDRELLGIIAAEYLKQTPGLLADLERAVHRADAPEVARWAHRLKGSSLQVGGVELGATTALLEDRARTGDLAEAAQLVRRIRIQASELASLLRSMTGVTA